MPAKEKNTTKMGVLEVICGPMFSGKSEELIRRLRRAKIAKQTIIIFKPSIDDRHSTKNIVSHDGNCLSAHPISDPNTIINVLDRSQATIVGIDEVQFFDKKIIPVICQLLDSGKRIIASGLDRDFRGAPFGPVPTLMAIADCVTKLQAICTQCNNDAARTQRLVNGKPAKFDDPIVLIGAQEAYQARCRDCFVIDKSFAQIGL